LEINRQLAEKKNFDDVRTEAEKANRAGTASDEIHGAGDSASLGGVFGWNGTPVYLGAASVASVPRYQMQPVRDIEVRHRFGISAIVLLLGLIAAILPYRPRAVNWAFLLWPAELMVVGVLAWLYVGPNWISVALCMVGLSASLFYLSSRLLGFLRRPRRVR